MTKLIEPMIPLQGLDLEIHDLKVRRNSKPGELAGYREKVDRAAASASAIQEEIRTLKKDAGGRETEVKEYEEKIQKLTVQANQARKNDEYHALLKEVSGLKAEKGRIEDALLDTYMQVDEKSKLEKIRTEEVEALEREFGEAKRRIEGEVAEIDREIEKHLDRRRALTGAVPPDVLREYERILDVKDDGLALVPLDIRTVVDDSGKITQYTCGGCNVNVTAQDVNMILLGRDLVRCGSCSRILYIQKGNGGS